MLTRIGDLGQNRRLTTTMLELQSRSRVDQQAVASGKAATSYAQIADRAGVLVRANDSRQIKAAFVERNEQLVARMQAADSALDGLVSIAERARNLLVQRLDGATGREVPLAAETEAMLAEVASKLNATFDGSYLFGGSRSGTPPVELPTPPITSADPTLYYQGDEVRASSRIEEGAVLEHGVLASEAPFAHLIAALGLAGSAHAADDQAGLEAALSQVGEALSGIVDVRSRHAVATARVETVAESQQSTILYLDEVIASIEDTDLPEVMARLSRDQANLEAAYLVMGRLNSLSLTDYLR